MALVPAIAHAQRLYAVTGIRNAGGIGYASHVASINNLGQVLGYYQWTSTGGRGSSRTNHEAWLDEGGVATPLSLGNFLPVKMNDLGTIIGDALGGHPSMYKNGTMYTLSTTIGFVTDIDNDDNVVGVLGGGAAPYSATEWSNGSQISLCPLGQMSTATAIGDGLIAGSVELNAGSGVWFFGGDINNPQFIMTGDPFYDTITAISSRGVAVGYREDRPLGGGAYYYAVMYKNGVLIPLDRTQTNGGSWANAINSQEVIVGAKNGHATMWRNGIETDLNRLIPANSGWVLAEAKSINDRGQIVGTGAYQGAPMPFLLNPTLPISITPHG
ncbi:MAG TPA: hypothetical protein VHE55_06985 [Fimbriimonadaceae bacterium]|nr:hypothetical protein [Fimbriimonadaceae bacterium]